MSVLPSYLVERGNAMRQEGEGMTELKPCPFCNGKPFGPYQYGTNWYVACEDCEVQMDSMFKHKVTEKWNRRASE